VEDINRHISELLFDHDCVIVPSLGGFLASNQPARILTPKHIIFPPFRHIAFNIFLKHNDGLLANRLVEVKNINYNEALQLIENYTTFCFETLEKGKKFILTEIGTLYYDKERNLQFEPFRNYNHLKESFGMSSINFLPIQRGEQTEKNNAIVEKVLRPSVPPSKSQIRQTVIRNKAYIGAVLVGAAMCWFAINLYMVGPKNYESTSLNPFDTQETNISKKDSLDISTSEKNLGSNIPLDTNVARIIPIDSSSLAGIPEVEKKDVNAGPEKSQVNIEPVIKEASIHQPVTTSLYRNLYVIAGVFKIKENADKMLNSLKQQGFVNAQIIETDNRHYVTFENATTKEGALAMIDTLHKKNLDSWIWKH
jgi:hypothetical protein